MLKLTHAYIYIYNNAISRDPQTSKDSRWIATFMGFKLLPWRFVMAVMRRRWSVPCCMTLVNVGLPLTMGRLQQAFCGLTSAQRTTGFWSTMKSSKPISTKMALNWKTLRKCAISSRTVHTLMLVFNFARSMTPRPLIPSMTPFPWSISFRWSNASSIGSPTWSGCLEDGRENAAKFSLGEAYPSPEPNWENCSRLASQ